jgi:hypothetical protein
MAVDFLVPSADMGVNRDVDIPLAAPMRTHLREEPRVSTKRRAALSTGSGPGPSARRDNLSDLRHRSGWRSRQAPTGLLPRRISTKRRTLA